MITSSLEARQYWCLLPEHDPLLGLLILLLHILHVHEGRVGIGLFGVRIREGRFVTDDRIFWMIFIFECCLFYLKGCSSMVFSLVGSDWYTPRLSFGIIMMVLTELL